VKAIGTLLIGIGIIYTLNLVCQRPNLNIM